MADPIIGARLGVAPVAPLAPSSKLGQAARSADGNDFASMLRQQLEHVTRIQNEADDGVKRILTGESDNLSEVFSAAKRAQIAFDLLMEIRNKLVDSYTELRQMRV
jgi:flagellar hook-basal body complex protein FliE